LKRLGVALRALVLLCALATEAWAQYQFVPAYPDKPLLGPSAAAGAVIWSHGAAAYPAKEDETSPTPLYVSLLRDQGFDVFRLNRPQIMEHEKPSAEALRARADELSARGYRKIVLAGQSAGAWISLMTARGQGIYAVIATAPAYYGTEHPGYFRNASFLFNYVGDVKGVRTLVAFFNDDPFDPGGRGPEVEAILSRDGVAHLVLDRPAGFSGHGSGNGGLFARRFGPCVVALVGDGPVPRLEDCETKWGEAPSHELPQVGPAPAAAADDGSGANDRFWGRWYGYYQNGREVMLVVEKIAATEVDAAYVIGPSIDAAMRAGIERRHGRIADGALVFAEAGKATLRYAPRPDGALDAVWTAADGHSNLNATLHRLPPQPAR
jgi:hypothetical protein